MSKQVAVPPAPLPTCGNCRFFREMPEPGACRRFPPPMRENAINQVADPFWPRVYKSDWCGEHKRKD